VADFQQVSTLIIVPDISAASGIDGTTTGTTDLFVNPSSASAFLPLRIIFEQMAAFNVLTPADISLGTDSPNFENVLALTTMLPLTSTQLTYIESARLIGFAPVAQNSTLKVNVRVAATVDVGGSYDFRIMVEGLFLPTS
jgi:hypothetical protein